MAKSKKRRISPKPKALLLCQGVIVEAGTNNLNLIRIFNSFRVAECPGQLWPFLVFAQLVGGIGRYKVWVEIHDLEEETTLARSPEMSVEFTDRLQAGNLMIQFASITVRHTGPYDVVLLADNLEIDRQQIMVTLPEEQANGDHPQES